VQKINKISPYFSLLLTSACATTGNAWVQEPLTREASGEWETTSPSPPPQNQPASRGLPVSSRTLGEKPKETLVVESDLSPPKDRERSSPSPRRPRPNLPIEGTVLGTFRNTYYDFPQETDYGGSRVTLYDGQCKSIGDVPVDFFEALCVQGSGRLARGNAVSFNRRDCECARICSKTQQKICFDTLDSEKFPWGRGALGQAITPLLTVAVDSDVIPLGTIVFIPEYVGLPRDVTRSTFHDGCFLAQDRGLKVKGQHVDVFTGQRTTTRLWNTLIPSNSGVTVVVNSPKCKSLSEHAVTGVLR
jgi:3D (Asp-Asp-Asp) domain-containing protein